MLLGGQEHSFWMLGAMLLDAGSSAFGLWEHCFWHRGAMLLELGDNENSRDPWLGPGCWEVIPNGSECGE